MKKLVKFGVDIAFEGEEFGEMLERLGAAVPEAHVRVIKLIGSGGGWPEMEVVIPEDKIGEFAKWYSEDDAEELEEEFREEAVAL